MKAALESLATVGYKELKKTGVFLVPGFAKFVVIKKPATKARKGINPFTKEPTVSRRSPPASAQGPAGQGGQGRGVARRAGLSALTARFCRRPPNCVTPAKAGVQFFISAPRALDTGFRRNDKEFR